MKKLVVATMIATLLAAAPAFAMNSLRAIEGTVDRVSPSGHTLYLVGGMRFTVPASISIELLKPGEEVTVAYQDGKDGQMQMTAYWIDAGPGGDSRN